MLHRTRFVLCVLCLLWFCFLAESRAVDAISRLEDTSSTRDTNGRGRGSGASQMTGGAISPSAGDLPGDPGQTGTALVPPQIVQSTSIILITSLTIETLVPSNNVLPSQTFSPVATITAVSPRTNAASHRHQIPFFWSWLRR